MPITRRSTLTGLAGATLLSAPARAQSFPTKPIRMIVPYPPGGPTDVLARLVALELGASLGQSIIVDNKPGASGAIGAREGQRAAPDGHTILIGNSQTHVSNVYLVKELGYDPAADFTPIAGLADLPYAFVVANALGVTDVAGLIALAKSKPGKLNYGSTGIGSGSHLAMELFKVRTGTDLQHIPFKGAAQLAGEIAAGRIDTAISTLTPVLGQIREGQLRALAVPSQARLAQFPDVPLLAEQGVADCEADAWLALFAPARLPAEIAAKLSVATLAALAKPTLKEAAERQGLALRPRDPVAFRAFHAAEMKKWAEVIRVARIEPE